MSGFSQDQLAALVAPLSRDHVKTRRQAGREFSYIEAWHAIAEANRIFGFDGWTREMIEYKCIAEREVKIGEQGRGGWRVGYLARVRIVACGIVREGCGYGSGTDVDPGAAHESAFKEAESDAMKRALVTFGNQFGLALYDKAQANVESQASPSRYDTIPPVATKTLAEIRDSLAAAIRRADTPDRVDGIIRVHTEDLARIKAAGPETYNRLMILARDTKEALGGPPIVAREVVDDVTGEVYSEYRI